MTKCNLFCYVRAGKKADTFYYLVIKRGYSRGKVLNAIYELYLRQHSTNDPEAIVKKIKELKKKKSEEKKKQKEEKPSASKTQLKTSSN